MLIKLKDYKLNTNALKKTDKKWNKNIIYIKINIIFFQLINYNNYSAFAIVPFASSVILDFSFTFLISILILLASGIVTKK